MVINYKKRKGSETMKEWYEKRERRAFLRNGVVVSAAAAIIAVGTATAFFTDRDGVSNIFTVGNIDISLEEPGWDPEKGKDMTPMEEVDKDPTVVNEGANEAYVFVRVSVPRALAATAGQNGEYVKAEVQDLFRYDLNQGWTQVKSEIEDGKSIYTYGYTGDDGNMRSLAKASRTEPVFDSVSLINLIEGQLDGSQLTIEVEALAIQTRDVGEGRPEEVLKLLEAGS